MQAGRSDDNALIFQSFHTTVTQTKEQTITLARIPQSWATAPPFEPSSSRNDHTRPNDSEKTSQPQSSSGYYNFDNKPNSTVDLLVDDDLALQAFASGLRHGLEGQPPNHITYGMNINENKLIFPAVDYSESITSNYHMTEMRLQRILTRNNVANKYNPLRGTEIFIKHIPHDATEVELIRFLEKGGLLYSLRIMLKQGGVYNRGYAYATYFTPEDAKVAISHLQKQPFRNGVYLSVKKSTSNNKLFIGCIPVKKTKDEVWQELQHQGVQKIVDVIMYRSYSNRAENRGYVFVEFTNHAEAALARTRMQSLELWGVKVAVDWSIPIPEVDEEIMSKVTNIFIRNLQVLMTREDISSLLYNFLPPSRFEKIYKFKDYCFIHLRTREEAEYIMACLKEYYASNDKVEITWAKPPSEETKPKYRIQQVAAMRPRNLRSNNQTTSFSGSLPSSSGSVSPASDMIYVDYSQMNYPQRQL